MAHKHPEFIHSLCRELYGDDSGAQLSHELIAMCAEYRSALLAKSSSPERPVDDCSSSSRFSERDVVMIAYPDHLTSTDRSPLRTLSDWCEQHVKNLVSTVHILPFHPSTAYDGYAITDYMGVDPKFGTWNDIHSFRDREFQLMFDLVLNHCSSSHPWFQQLVDGELPGKDYFITRYGPQDQWLSSVRRARNLPLLRPTPLSNGESANVWVTYHNDLVDVDWCNPRVCWEFVNILLDSILHGFSGVRLDAFAYVWKAVNTTCVNQPQCKIILQLLRACLDAAGAPSSFILPSLTNVTQHDNVAFLSQGAQLTYHLPLAALMLHTLYSGETSVLTKWLENCPAAPQGGALLNLAASHDGIGLTWCKNILSQDQIDQLCSRAIARGGNVQTRQPTAASPSQEPWEICITSWSACSPDQCLHQSMDQSTFLNVHIDRFIALHSVVAALRGVPAFYFSLFVAGENDHARVQHYVDLNTDPEACCLPRVINRGRFTEEDWKSNFSNHSMPQSLVLSRIQAMLRARTSCSAFHPDNPQFFASANLQEVLPSSVFFLKRGYSEDDINAVACITNFGADCLNISAQAAIELVGHLGRVGGGICRNLLTDQLVDLRRGLLLTPYQTVWLTSCIFDSANQLRDLPIDLESCSQVMEAKSLRVDVFNTCNKPAELLGLDIENSFQFRFRAISPESEKGRILLQQLLSPDYHNSQPDFKFITFVHHGQSIHKLKSKICTDPCLCFDTTLPNEDQSNLLAWLAQVDSKAAPNPCPYFDSSLVDPPLTRSGIDECNVHFDSAISLLLPQPDVLAASTIRTLQTAMLNFPSCSIKSVEALRAMIGPHSHSQRVGLPVLRQLFPRVDFSLTYDAGDDDGLWLRTSPAFESRCSLDARMISSLEHAFSSTSPYVAIVTHFTSLFSMLMDGDDPRLLGARSANISFRDPIIDCRLDPNLEIFQQNPKLLGKQHSFSTILVRERICQRFASSAEWLDSLSSQYYELSLIDLFDRAYRSNPHAIAVCGGVVPEPGITYEEVYHRSFDLCKKILKLKENQRESTMVGVYLGRSVDTLVSMLAILRAGCSYFALHPNDPVEYHDKLVELTSSLIIVTNDLYFFEAVARFSSKCTIFNSSLILASESYSDLSAFPIASPNSTACCLFTSGSSGLPKGILISHAAMVNFMFSLRSRESQNSTFGEKIYGPHARVLQLSRSSFDIHFWEYIGTVGFGGTLVLLPESLDANFDTQVLLSTMRKFAVNWCFMVPSVCALLLDEVQSEFYSMPSASRAWKPIPSLRQLYVGGEVVTTDLMKSLSRELRCVLHHVWGPAECTIYSMSHLFDPQSQDDIIPLGSPYGNYELMIADENLQPCDEGELLVGGKCLFQRYAGMNDDQMQRFLFTRPDGLKFYRTGDMVKRINDQLYFNGRRDRQVKLRGQRIELDAVESVLRSLSDAKEVAVRVWNLSCAQSLVAYIVMTSNYSHNQSEFHKLAQNHCMHHLPNYMIPSQFIQLQQLPRTPNRKVDYQSLPSPASYFSQTQPSMKIGIIGAGVAGILTAMACRRANLEFVLIDSSMNFGGIWSNGTARSNEEAPSRLQQPSEGYSLKGKFSCRYPDSTEIMQHMNQVIDEYQLRSSAQFGLHVTNVVAKSNTGRLEVTVEPEILSSSSSSSLSATKLEFDAIVSCVGRFHHRHSVTPQWALKSSQLQELNLRLAQKHIWELKCEDVEGRDVVIIGGGAYSIEAIDTCLHRYGAKSVTLITRHMHPVVPRTWFESSVLTRLFWTLASGVPLHQIRGGKLLNLSRLASVAVGRHYHRAGIAHMFQDFDFADRSLAVSDSFFSNAQLSNVKYIRGDVIGYSPDATKLIVQPHNQINSINIPAACVVFACGFSSECKDLAPFVLSTKSPPSSSHVLSSHRFPDLYLGTIHIAEPRIGFVGAALGRGVFSNPQTMRLQIDILINHFTRPLICSRSAAYMRQWIDSLPPPPKGELVGTHHTHMSELVAELKWQTRQRIARHRSYSQSKASSFFDSPSAAVSASHFDPKSTVLQAAESVGLSTHADALDIPLVQLGMDSLRAVRFRQALIRALPSRFHLPSVATLIWDLPTLTSIVDYVANAQLPYTSVSGADFSCCAVQKSDSKLDQPFIGNDLNNFADTDPLFSLDEALQYLHDELKIDADMARVRSDPIPFLTEVCKGIHRTVPFQSFSLLLLSRAFRRLPPHQQIKRDVLARIGGCCYVLNVFVRELIRALGLWQTFYVRCAIHNVDDCHMSVIIRDLVTQGDLWMVDVGCGYILPQPICLSFEGPESSVYQHGFLRVKFVRYDPSIPASESAPNASDADLSKLSLWRLHSTSSTFDERELTLTRPDGFNHVFWRMSLQPRPLHDAGETQQVRAFTGYQKLRASIGSGSSCAMTYFKADFNADQGLQARVLRDINGALVGEVVSVTKLIDLLLQHFPAFDRDAVERAVCRLTSSDE